LKLVNGTTTKFVIHQFLSSSLANQEKFITCSGGTYAVRNSNDDSTIGEMQISGEAEVNAAVAATLTELERLVTGAGTLVHSGQLHEDVRRSIRSKT
jgi:hypothetical protein